MKLTDKQDIVLVLPNIRSAHNVGSMFRTADAAGVSHVYLCGYSPQPVDHFGRVSGPQKEIAKTALGAELVVPYTYSKSLASVVKKLKKMNYVVVGLEQHVQSINLGQSTGLNNLKKIIKQNKKIALVVGEEVSGMTQKDISLMDHLIELPMYGTKESLNVSVATGVALYILKLFIRF